MGSFEELDTDEPLAKRLERHAYDRLIMLSDGVFAIAATLLALEIKVPQGWRGKLDDLITTATVSQVISYAISFMVVAIYWMGNRRILAMFRRVDAPATLLALMVLMLIALLPPVSRTLITDQGRVSESSSIYVIYITLIGLVQAALWTYGAFVAKLADASLTMGFKAAHAGLDGGGAHRRLRHGHAVDGLRLRTLGIYRRGGGHDGHVRPARTRDEARHPAREDRRRRLPRPPHRRPAGPGHPPDAGPGAPGPVRRAGPRRLGAGPRRRAGDRPVRRLRRAGAGGPVARRGLLPVRGDRRGGPRRDPRQHRGAGPVRPHPRASPRRHRPRASAPPAPARRSTWPSSTRPTPRAWASGPLADCAPAAGSHRTRSASGNAPPTRRRAQSKATRCSTNGAGARRG